MNMGKITWAKGFVRVWAAISLLFGLLVFGITYTAWPQPSSTYVRTETGEVMVDNAGRSVSLSMTRTAIKNARAAGDTAAIARLESMSEAAELSLKRSRVDSIKEGVRSFVFGSSLLLLMIALCRWVINGFRPQA
jgi:hypothetical protein